MSTGRRPAITGDGDESFSPRFTLHGFRYIEITGLDEPIPLNAVRGLPLSSINEIKAGYECSDPRVNRLWDNIKWSTLSNFVSIPMDCSQRNERLGWMGDISVYSPSAETTFIPYDGEPRALGAGRHSIRISISHH